MGHTPQIYESTFIIRIFLLLAFKYTSWDSSILWYFSINDTVKIIPRIRQLLTKALLSFIQHENRGDCLFYRDTEESDDYGASHNTHNKLTLFPH